MFLYKKIYKSVRCENKTRQQTKQTDGFIERGERLQIRLMTAANNIATFDVFITDAKPSISVVRDDGTVTVTKWTTLREALAYLIGCGCEIDAPTDERRLIDRAVTAKYAALR